MIPILLIFHTINNGKSSEILIFYHFVCVLKNSYRIRVLGVYFAKYTEIKISSLKDYEGEAIRVLRV
jgi:hypothetical protein